MGVPKNGNESSLPGTPELVVAVLAGADGDLGRAIATVRERRLPLWIFDTTPDERHRRTVPEGPDVEVVATPWPKSFAAARNTGLEIIERSSRAYTHVLWLDSDEHLESRPLVEDLSKMGSRVGCPTISDPTTATQGVARVIPLGQQLRYRGLVHEYVVDSRARACTLVPVSGEIIHEGYERRDRSTRNTDLLLQQIRHTPTEIRWRPFLVRDGHKRLSSEQLVRLNEEQATLPHSSEDVGGITEPEYLSMLARYTCLALLGRNEARLADAVLAAHETTDTQASSELLYLRLMSQAVANQIDMDLFAVALDKRVSSVAREAEDQPWLDAAIAHILDVMGEHEDATAYRTQSTRYTDEFFIDSEIR